MFYQTLNGCISLIINVVSASPPLADIASGVGPRMRGNRGATRVYIFCGCLSLRRGSITCIIDAGDTDAL